MLVTRNCFEEPLNRRAASLPRYRNPPCGNPRAGKCLQRRDIVPLCVRGCCRPALPRAALPVDRVRQGFATRAKQQAVACADKPGPDGVGTLVLAFDRDGGLVRLDESPPFSGTDRGTCLAEALRGLRAPPSEAGMTAEITFRLPP